MPTTLTLLDPTRTPRAQVEALTVALHGSLMSSWAQDQPHEPRPTPAILRADLLLPAWDDQVRLVVAEGDGGSVHGHARVRMPVHDNRHVGMVELHVSPDRRRQGLGRALLDAACSLLRAQGRRVVWLEARAGSAMESFAAACGAELALMSVRRHQQIADLDLDRVAALRAQAEQASAAYRLESWTGSTPPHRRADLAAAVMALNDAPTGGLDAEDEVWDAARIAVRDRSLVVAGLRLHTQLALAPDGRPAGCTDVAVSQDGTFGWQCGTGVAPAHRGHRLGLRLKAAMVERLRADEPALQVVSTFNAEGNKHMIAINDALGYRAVEREGEWELRLG